MGLGDEPKMDELKRLLRRLDSLDGSQSLARTTKPSDSEPRGYVGALRGAPVAGEDAAPGATAPAPAKRSGAFTAFIAAAAAALVSTAVVYLAMSQSSGPADRRAGGLPGAERPEPDRAAPGGPASQAPTSRTPASQPPAAAPGGGQGTATDTDTAGALVRSAEDLLDKGEVEAGRALLRQAAERGSGVAALKLGISYDPAQAKRPSFADSQTNPALAKAWYERALALGTQEAASYIASPGGR